MSKPVRLTIFLMETLLALALAALIIMSTAWFQRLLEGRVIAGLENLTGGRVEISHFRFRPWIFHITLQNLVIHGSEPAGAPALFSARAVEAGISPQQLLRRRLRLRFLDLDNFEMRLRVDTRGATNLPGPLNSAEARLKDLMDLSIGRLTISHSAFYWNDQRQPVEVNARALAILLRRTRGGYSGTFSSSDSSIRSPLGSPPPVTLNGRFELSSSRLVLSPLAWDSEASTGEAALTILFRPDVQASGSFHTSTQLAALARVLHAPELRGGILLAEGLAAYQGGFVSAQGRAQGRQLVLSTPAFRALRLDAATSYTLEKNHLYLANLVVSVWGGTAQGTLQANFQDAPAKFRLNTRLHRVRLDDVLRSPLAPAMVAKQVHPTSIADGVLSATWSGRWQGLQADFDLGLEAPASPPPGSLPVSGAVSGTLTGGRGLALYLANAELETPHSTISARGAIRQSRASPAAVEPLALTVSTDDFEEWRPLFQELIATPSGIPLRLKSRAEFSGQFTGSMEDPFLRGRVSVGPFVYHGWEWDGVSATVGLNPRLIQITGGRIAHEKSSFELNISSQLDDWRLTPTCTVHFAARAQQTPIEGLEAALNLEYPLRGLITGNLDLEGNAATMAGSGAVRIEAGEMADEPFDSFSAQLRVNQSVWKLQSIMLRKKEGRMSGDFTLEPERRFARGELIGSDFRLADIHHLPMTPANPLLKGELDGELSFEARGQGTPEDFDMQTAWRVLKVSVAGTPWGQLRGTLTGKGNQFSLLVDGESAEGNVHASAHTTAQGEWPMEADGQYTGMRVDPWIHAFFNREFGATVTATGSFHVGGPLRAPEKIIVDSKTQSLAVDFPTVQWRNVQPVDMHYSGRRLALSRFTVRGPSTELGIEGSVNFAGGVALALSTDGTANATVLTVFDPGLQATGHSTLRLRLTGTPDRPLLNGAIEVQDTSLGYSQLPFRFNNLQGTINLQGERAVISSLRGSCGGGTVDLTGFVTLSPNPRFEVRGALSQVRVRYPTSFTSVFDGNLRLGGGVDGAQLQGELVVHQMVLNQNVNIISKIIESSSSLVEPPAAINSPIASKIRLNIRVTSAPPVQLQTPNLGLTGDIDLRLQGRLANPVQVGSIHLLSGESVFRGNRYTLVRGDISMTNPSRTQAYLDLEAQTRVQNYDLTLDISGPFDRLKFSYRSDPPLAQTDVISLLALGYVQQEQAFPGLQGGNPTTTVGASALLSQALSSQIGGRIQHLFGVSRIKIDPYVGMPGLGSGERVTVEEQITRDLTLTYITDTSYSQYTIYQFEWNVTNNMSILGVRDPNGIFGIEFRFRRRFK